VKIIEIGSGSVYLHNYQKFGLFEKFVLCLRKSWKSFLQIATWLISRENNWEQFSFNAYSMTDYTVKDYAYSDIITRLFFLFFTTCILRMRLYHRSQESCPKGVTRTQSRIINNSQLTMLIWLHDYRLLTTVNNGQWLESPREMGWIYR